MPTPEDKSTPRPSPTHTHVRADEDEQDITDSPHDQERLKPDVAVIDLPDVSDIPGQEHVHVPPLGELADTTISSDDEEGRGLLDDDEPTQIGSKYNKDI